MLEVKFQPFPSLETNRLLLRKITDDDVDGMFYLRSAEIIMQHIDRPVATTKEDALKHINVLTTNLDSNNGITWGIALKEDNKLIGTIGFWQIQKENYRAEIGYMLNDKFHRKGLMQEAMVAAINYAFDEMKLHSIEATIKPSNIASAKILEKNHFKLEAHFRENYFFNGKFLNSKIYSLLISDWKNSKS